MGLTSRRNREAAPGQSTCCAPEQWSRPWDTNKLSVAQGRQAGLQAQFSCGTYMGLGKCQGMAELWQGPQVHFPMPLILTTVGIRTVLMQREEAHGWEQRVGSLPHSAAVAKDVGRVSSKVGYPHEPCGILWMRDDDMMVTCAAEKPQLPPLAQGKWVLEMWFTHTIFCKTHITNKTSALSTFSTFREFSETFLSL